MTSNRPGDLRIGIIGCDTSHSVEYAARLNDPSNPDHIPGARITVAFPTMSPDMPWSRTRAEGFVKELVEKRGVRVVGSIDELLAECDAVLLCSLDGRPHPEQARPILEARKPVFIDKPIAASYRAARDLLLLAEKLGTPAFGASAIRWYPGVVEVAQADVGPVRGAISYGPSPIEPTHPDLFFYGIHPTEALFTVLGSGCRSVQRVTTQHSSVVVGEWEDGRVGTVHLMHRWPAEYKVTMFGDSGVAEQTRGGDYTPQLREIVKFFQTGVVPVSREDTLEIYAFMAAADESKQRGGAPVTLEDVTNA